MDHIDDDDADELGHTGNTGAPLPVVNMTTVIESTLGDNTWQNGNNMTTDSPDLWSEAITTMSQGNTNLPVARSHDKSNPYVQKHGLAIMVPPVNQEYEYVIYEEPSIVRILEEYEDLDQVSYLVKLSDQTEEIFTLTDLVNYSDGEGVLNSLDSHTVSDSDEDPLASGAAKYRSFSHRRSDRDTSVTSKESDDEILARRSRRIRRQAMTRKIWHTMPTSSTDAESLITESEDDLHHHKLKRQRAVGQSGTRSTRAAAQRHINYSDAIGLELSSNTDTGQSDEGTNRSRSGRRRNLLAQSQMLHNRLPKGTRRSGRRDGPHHSMREVEEDEISDQDTPIAGSKTSAMKEQFLRLPEDRRFRIRHNQTCDTCNVTGDNEERGDLIFCQGCTAAYHQRCLGPRSSREHLVTKIGDGNFVLQCKRCSNCAKVKDDHAPDQSRCLSCHEHGPASMPFRERKTTRAEQKEREDNNGQDPVVEVPTHMLNRSENLLFRCAKCHRACHMQHLESKPDAQPDSSQLVGQATSTEDLYAKYSRHWRCQDCWHAPGEVQELVAWRPLQLDLQSADITTTMVGEDAKEYLIKWKDRPYMDTSWMAGAWVWGVTKSAMRKAFTRRNNDNNTPKMTTVEAVPEDYMRVDIVFDVVYSKKTLHVSAAADRGHIKDVEKALVKFKGLGYEDVVWIQPPSTEEAGRCTDFQCAYEDWIMGLYIQPPQAKKLATELGKLRLQNFAQNLQLKEQPSSLVGGKLMEYQLDGINWLYYQWYRQQNAILADEMGLGKTIQIIGFLNTLKDNHQCWPCLVVVPNSTCPNWRREIKQWAPDLRVVTYYGSAQAKHVSRQYELFSEETCLLKCHVVVTSYDAAQDPDFRRIFRSVRWTGLIVDEGQRLKNDKSILYNALNALKPPFKLLMTGTPLQNNARELFNLLQFLDPREDAEALEEKYVDLSVENIKELHAKLQPYFLRRTKAQVLSFLPPVAQIIVPVSLSILQKKLYRSILAKNPELISTIIGAKKNALKQTERANLNNILMQLRKCLCHPFVYSRQVEERTQDKAVAHRTLVDASSKLQLLELMLPRLLERGHRVLIFSQFLDMLDMVEDFLDGLGLLHQRLDGSMNSLEKQKRIDEFNAPYSQLFAFLLSTRAGGVGINLATADTVIILDPDFNPHQDIQALSRAHRIGQKKKVLVFQLITRLTAEEKILQIGKRKMMLDHVLIEQMATEDDAGIDLESILRYGTEAIFADENTQEIQYDAISIDKLLDRSQIENTKSNNEQSAESTFSFAKVWVNDKGSLEEGSMEERDEHIMDASVWASILQQRELEARIANTSMDQDLGRGRRRRRNVDYVAEADYGPLADTSPVPEALENSGQEINSDSDTDFQAVEEGDDEADEQSDLDIDIGPVAVATELGQGEVIRRNSQIRPIITGRAPYDISSGSKFARAGDPPIVSNAAQVAVQTSRPLPASTSMDAGPTTVAEVIARATKNREPAGPQHCLACGQQHTVGWCPLKLAGVEQCNLCSLAHFGQARTCPHLNSVTQLRVMSDTIKQSNESDEMKDLARKRIGNLIKDLNKRKRRRLDMEQQLVEQSARLLSHESDKRKVPQEPGIHAISQRAVDSV